jgi:hypothetical protein
MPKFTELIVGNYVFELTVTDEDGLSSTKRCKVEVKNNFAFKEAIVIFPNPVGYVLNYMMFRSQNQNAMANVVIVDAGGRTIKKAEIQVAGGASRNSMPVQELKPGIYFLTVTYQGGQKKTKKFFKK